VDTLDKLTLGVEEVVDTFPCLECGAVYRKPWTLRTHMKKKHNFTENEPVFTCEECDANFRDMNHLSKHKKTHEKIFVCKKCEEVFFSRKEINDHMKIHLVCDICARVCNSEYLLKRHISSHNLNT
jgi:KRAB domain-containing zinc finger protein